MKGLRKYLAPFAPDQSGACAVLMEFGGILVICDAGGCVGNICGFDEPRWFTKKSAIFSAGLRDMDAILGRDDRLVEKLAKACQRIDAEFTAVIGTPVPAVIATDYRAIKRMAEAKTGLSMLAIESTGMELYDVGEERAWYALFQTFAKETYPVNEGRIGILGATPLNIHSLNAPKEWEEGLLAEGAKEVVCYGMGAGMDAVKKAASVSKNLVIAPAALKTAKLLERRFGTPYEVVYPGAERVLEAQLAKAGLTLEALQGKKILILHQQVLANALREMIGSLTDSCTCAGWFMMKKELRREDDCILKEEDAFISWIAQQDFDAIIGDPIFKSAIPFFKGTYVELPHFAVSGKL